MKKLHFTLLLLTLLSLFSCEETIQLGINQSSSTLVIEGLITNKPGKQYIKISRTAGFYGGGATEKITTAIVKVTDDMGKEILFHHNPLGDTEKNGYYFDTENFVGEIGREYSLYVIAEGKTYEAHDKLMSVTTIDSLSSRINEQEQSNPKITGQIYEVLAYMKEPQETKDYYLFRYYRNNDFHSYNLSSDIYFTDDVGVGKNINGLASPVYFKEADTARLELYSLSRTAFLFYNDLSNLLNNDGGMISSPPANPRTNLTNGALGFFRVSAVSSATLIVNK
jgi:predicted transcriptional regulator YdeE